MKTGFSNYFRIFLRVPYRPEERPMLKTKTLVGLPLGCEEKSS